MPRTLYSPRLSDDVVRALYREAQRRRMPMTRLADEMITTALAATSPVTGENVGPALAALPIPEHKAA